MYTTISHEGILVRKRGGQAASTATYQFKSIGEGRHLGILPRLRYPLDFVSAENPLSRQSFILQLLSMPSVQTDFQAACCKIES